MALGECADIVGMFKKSRGSPQWLHARVVSSQKAMLESSTRPTADVRTHFATEAVIKSLGEFIFARLKCQNRVHPDASTPRELIVNCHPMRWEHPLSTMWEVRTCVVTP